MRWCPIPVHVCTCWQAMDFSEDQVVGWLGWWQEGEWYRFIKNLLSVIQLHLKHDTLIHYLLDELYMYEESYSDALCPIPWGVDESHLGEATLVAPLTADEARCMMQIHVAATYEAVQKACASWALSFVLVTTADTHHRSTSIEHLTPENLHQPPPFPNNAIPVPSYPPLLLHDASILSTSKPRSVLGLIIQITTAKVNKDNKGETQVCALE